MDRAVRAVLGGLALLAAASALAHPHSDIDQQVALSVGRDAAEIRVMIMPSYTAGAAIFAHVDSDGDGAISEPEAQDFARSVAETVELSAGGRATVLTTASASVPAQQAVASGSAALVVQITARYARLDPGDALSLRIGYEEVSHDWFIQPFLQPDLSAVDPAPDVQRSSDGTEVTLRLRP